MDLTVCERWKLRGLDPAASPWFLDWVQREPGQVSRHLTAVLALVPAHRTDGEGRLLPVPATPRGLELHP